MLILSRRQNEKILFPELGIEVELLQTKGSSARLGVRAPRSIRVVRAELECTEASQRPNSQVNEPPEHVDMAAIQSLLDSANLALYLARNQLKHEHSEQAEETLGQAIEAMEQLERVLSRHPEWKQAAAVADQVNEPATEYALGPQTTRQEVWVVVDPNGDLKETQRVGLSPEMKSWVMKTVVQTKGFPSTDDVNVVPKSAKQMLNDISSHSPDLLFLQSHERADWKLENATLGLDENDWRESDKTMAFIALPGVSSLKCYGTERFGDAHMTVWK